MPFWRFVLALVFSVAAAAQDVHVRVSPDVTTGIEGTTSFPTIQNALDHHPLPGRGRGGDGGPGRVIIEIAPGTYQERIIVTQNHPGITLLGMGKRPEDTVITNSLNAKTAGGTFFTETVEINGAGFAADNLTFENAAGNTGQAVAVAVRADRVIFKHCRFLGHHDTLFADFGRQFYSESYIEGGVDFVFGNAAAVFDRVEFHLNGRGYVTAQSRTDPAQRTGYVIEDSRITAEAATPGLFLLGRPWRPFARVVVMETELPAALDPAGWSLWRAADATPPSAYYAEFRNRGPGAEMTHRVSWAHRLSAGEAARYRPRVFLAGEDRWDAEAEAANLP